MSTYFVMMTSSGSPITIGQLAGSGLPRIFSGDAIYVYRLSGALWTTRDFGTNWINIIPAGLSVVSTVAQTSGSLVNTTYVTGAGSTGIPARYQTYPEDSVWSSGSSIPSGNLSDSVSSVYDAFPILIGNDRLSNAARVWKAGIAPNFDVSISDTGFPTSAQVTDLDLGE